MAFYLEYFLLLMLGCVTCFAVNAPEPPDHHKFCNKTLRHLAACQANFVQCTIDNSTPAMSCTHCFDLYENMEEGYDNLIKNCSDLYINKNRRNIVYNMQKLLVEVWNKGFCYDCFENNETLSNSTLVFNSLKTEFDNCINNSPKDVTCMNCMGNYVDLNEFYRKMDEEKKGEICFDIQDAMNRTRSIWSKDLKCCRREFNLTLFIVGSTLFGVIPLIFYLGMYGYTKRLERNHAVLDSNSASENQEVVASTSAGVSSGTLVNLQTQPETSLTATAAENDTSTEGQSFSSQQTAQNLLIAL